MSESNDVARRILQTSSYVASTFNNYFRGRYIPLSRKTMEMIFPPIRIRVAARDEPFFAVPRIGAVFSVARLQPSIQLARLVAFSYSAISSACSVYHRYVGGERGGGGRERETISFYRSIYLRV